MVNYIFIDRLWLFIKLQRYSTFHDLFHSASVTYTISTVINHGFLETTDLAIFPSA